MTQDPHIVDCRCVGSRSCHLHSQPQAIVLRGPDLVHCPTYITERLSVMLGTPAGVCPPVNITLGSRTGFKLSAFVDT